MRFSGPCSQPQCGLLEFLQAYGAIKAVHCTFNFPGQEFRLSVHSSSTSVFIYSVNSGKWRISMGDSYVTATHPALNSVCCYTLGGKPPCQKKNRNLAESHKLALKLRELLASAPKTTVNNQPAAAGDRQILRTRRTSITPEMTPTSPKRVSRKSNTGIVMILEIFSFECYFPRDLLSDFEIQMRIRQRRST